MNTHAALLVIVMATVTMLLRFLPFILFRKQTPPYISYLGQVLPAAIIGMLVVYCLKDTVLTKAPFGALKSLPLWPLWDCRPGKGTPS